MLAARLQLAGKPAVIKALRSLLARLPPLPLDRLASPVEVAQLAIRRQPRHQRHQMRGSLLRAVQAAGGQVAENGREIAVSTVPG